MGLDENMLNDEMAATTFACNLCDGMLENGTLRIMEDATVEESPSVTLCILKSAAGSSWGRETEDNGAWNKELKAKRCAAIWNTGGATRHRRWEWDRHGEPVKYPKATANLWAKTDERETGSAPPCITGGLWRMMVSQGMLMDPYANGIV